MFLKAKNLLMKKCFLLFQIKVKIMTFWIILYIVTTAFTVWHIWVNTPDFSESPFIDFDTYVMILIVIFVPIIIPTF